MQAASLSQKIETILFVCILLRLDYGNCSGISCMQMLQMMKYAHAHGSSKSQIRRLLHGVRRQFTPLKAAFQPTFPK